MSAKSTQILAEIRDRLRRHYGPQPRPAGSLNEAVGAAIPARKTAELFLRFLRENYDGDLALLAAEPSAKLRSELLGLKGIGPETADAILLDLLGHPVFAIDVHAYRVFTRHGLAAEESSYEELQEIGGVLPADPESYRELHWLLARAGREFCRAEASCENCPLKGVNW